MLFVVICPVPFAIRLRSSLLLFEEILLSSMAIPSVSNISVKSNLESLELYFKKFLSAGDVILKMSIMSFTLSTLSLRSLLANLGLSEPLSRLDVDAYAPEGQVVIIHLPSVCRWV